MPLVTENIAGVEIARAGKFTGVGSASGGDAWTVADLEALAASYGQADTVPVTWRAAVTKPQVGLGHGPQGHIDDPDLLDAAGAPALGWVSGLRVSGDRLLADLTDVPRKVADLIRARAYRARSMEFLRIPQAGGGERRVFSGLALLGGRRPAVTGLKDVFALYGEDVESRGDMAGAVIYMDDAADQQDPQSQDPATTAGHITPGKGMHMDELRKLLGLADDATDDQVREAVAKLAQERKDVDGLKDTLATLRAEVDQLKAGDTDGDGDTDGETDSAAAPAAADSELVAKYEAQLAAQKSAIDALKARADLGAEAHKTLYEAKRDEVLDVACREGRIALKDRDVWATHYAADADGTTALLATIPPNPVLATEYGSEDASTGESSDALYQQMTARMGSLRKIHSRKGA